MNGAEGAAVNVTADDLVIEAADGDIGAPLRPVFVDLTGGLTARTSGDAYILDTSGTLNLVSLLARGNATISSTGNVLDANDDSGIPTLNILAGSLRFEADMVGTPENPIEIELDGGALSSDVFGDLYVTVQGGDVLLDDLVSRGGLLDVQAGGDVNLGLVRSLLGTVALESIGGSILDANGDAENLPIGLTGTSRLAGFDIEGEPTLGRYPIVGGDRIVSYETISGDRAADFAFDAEGNIFYTGGSGMPLDFETESRFELLVEATDTEGQTDTAWQVFYVTDTQEGPDITLGQMANLYEHPDLGQFVLQVEAIDVEGDNVTSIDLAPDSVGLGFAINNSDRITVNDPALLDFETDPSPRTLNVIATDSTGLSKTGSVLVTLLDHTTTPTFPALTVSVREKGSTDDFVMTLVAEDADNVNGDSQSFEILSVVHYLLAGGTGTMTGIFNVDAATNALRADTSNVNFLVDDRFELTIRATDRDGNQTTGMLTVDVSDKQEKPIVSVDDPFEFGENPLMGQVVGQATAVDPDGTTEFTWTIRFEGGGNEGGLDIDPVTGEIFVTDPAPLDFETTTSYDLVVQLSDGLQIDVTDVTVTVDNATERDVAVTKTTEARGAVQVGDTVTFVVEVSNPGEQAEADVAVSDPFTGLSNLNLDSVDFTGGATSTLVAGSLGASGLDDTAGLPLGATVTYTVTGTVSTSVSGNLPSSVATATIASDTLPSNNAAATSGGLLVHPAAGGVGMFAAGSSTPLANSVLDLALGDLNRDGYLDAVAILDSAIIVLTNDGTASFSSMALPTSDGFRSVAVGDVNQDGLLDLVTASSTTNSAVWLNDGSGGFSLSSTFTFGSGATSKQDVALADLNRDGALDAIFGGAGSRSPEVAMNHGDGTFATGIGTTDAGVMAQSLVVADLDGDPDALIVTPTGVQVQLNVVPPNIEVPSNFVGQEDNVLALAGVIVNNSLVGTMNVTVSINAAAMGNLSVDGGAQTGSSLALSGNAVAINALLATLEFTPVANSFGTITLTVSATNAEAPVDANTDNVYQVEVRIEDAGGLIDTATVTITVNPVNDNAPVFTSAATASIAENTTVVQTVAATDADLPTQTTTFSITGNGPDDAKFQVVAADQLRFISAPVLTNPTDDNGDNIYEVQVLADDGNGLTTRQTVLVTITVDASPQVTDVFVSGSDWNPASPADLAPFSFFSGIDPTAPLPWANLNTIEVVFDQDVNISSADLSLTGINVADYTTDIGFSYNDVTFTATWMLPTNEFIGIDRLSLNLPGTVTSAESGSALSLHNGVGYDLSFDVLPGDVNRNGSTTVTDLVNVAARVRPGTFGSNYDKFHDLDGNGAISVTDLTNTSSRIVSFLPLVPPSPVAPSAAAAAIVESIADTRVDLVHRQESLITTRRRRPVRSSVRPAADQQDKSLYGSDLVDRLKNQALSARRVDSALRGSLVNRSHRPHVRQVDHNFELWGSDE